MSPKVVGIVAYEGVGTLDFTGPLHALQTAESLKEDVNGPALYKTVVLGVNGRAFASDSGLRLTAHKALDLAPPLDALIIPGGRGIWGEVSHRVSQWLTNQTHKIERILCVSTGVYGVAPSGLLDGGNVTTHWRFAADLARRFPLLHVSSTASVLRHGSFLTSASAMAGIDMTLLMIEDDYGPQIALAAARELVVTLRPPGDDEVQVDLSGQQSSTIDRMGDLPAWIATHLQHNLSVDVLATRAGVCPRHFGRLFKQVFNSTPADFVERLRLGEARRQLVVPRSSVESVAASVGFKSPDAFRRAFERRHGISPSSYRKRFQYRPREPLGVVERTGPALVPGRGVRMS
jgi:transcriptional regulator GlxA family with amidase domain